MSSEATDAVEGVAAFVLQCVKCKTIVGDSWSYVSSNKAWNTITLSGASNVDLLDSSAQTSKRTTDFGSTFKLFRCRGCQELLGRIYKTTSRELDELREHFTYMMDKVSAYSFGSAEVRGEGTTSENGGSEGSEGSGGYGGHGGHGATPLLVTHDSLAAHVQPMEAEILRLKSLCLVFAERLAQLEGQAASAHGAGGTSPVLAKGTKRRLSEELLHESGDSNNNNGNEPRAHKKKRI